MPETPPDLTSEEWGILLLALEFYADFDHWQDGYAKRQAEAKALLDKLRGSDA